MNRDFIGREIKVGDTIAVAMRQGSSSAHLVARYVRSVGDGFIVVQPSVDEPSDRRQIKPLFNFQNSMVIS